MVSYPQDWEENDLGNLAFIKTGSKNNEDKVSGGKYPFYVRSEKVERINTFSYDTEAILVPGEGNIGSVFHYVNGKFDVHQRVYAITNFRDTLNAKYLYWFMVKNFGNYALSQTSKATVDSLRLPAFKNFCVVIPPLPEQQVIADALTAFDTHINNLAKLIEKKKMIRDGAVEDLVSGKRRLAGFSGKWEEISFNDSVIPKARIGWQGLKKDEYLQSGYSYLISGTDFYRGTISFEEISYVSKDRYDMDSNIQVKSGDVLVTKDGTIGKVAIVPNIDKRATLNSGVFVFRVIEKIKRKFLYWILRSSLFSNFIDELSAGSTIKHLYQKDLKQLKFVIPTSLSEQQAIADILTAMDKEIANLEKEKEKYIALKAGAMDDLLTGKIRLA
ncbi:restriction endonuclease subunit S [Fannyhessea vaginae]|uniref:restriction endonuclease subunit S n=1 Tax=Fannyhessea vaginae TaxID=82135 RepID=UPI003A813517